MKKMTNKKHTMLTVHCRQCENDSLELYKCIATSKTVLLYTDRGLTFESFKTQSTNNDHRPHRKPY